MRMCLLLLLAFPVQGQVSMDDFLSAAQQEPTLQAFNSQQNFLSTKKSYRLAPIQKLEFRSESNQLDRTRQDYALRINPANPWEMNRTNRYFKTYQELLQLDRDRALKESLLVRYEVIIGWLYSQELRELKAEDKRITEKLLAILEGQRFSGFFDAEDYVELKLDQVDKTIELEETLFEIENQRRRVEALYESARLKSIEWPQDAIISVEQLMTVVDSLMVQPVPAGEVAYRQKQLDLATTEWQLEKANVNVGFLQTEYQPWREEQGRRPWSIGFGVTLPVFNPNKGDMAKQKLEALEAEGERDLAQREQQAGREISREKLKSLIQRYREVQTMTEGLNVGAMATTLQQINDSNPMAGVRVQNNLIKLKTMAARLKQEIYLSYIEFLTYSEALQQQPLVNYLSPTLSSLPIK